MGMFGLVAEFIGETTGAATCGIWVTVFIERLTDDDQPTSFCAAISATCAASMTRETCLNDFQRAGDGGGRVAESETDAFFTVVNCKDSHGMLRDDERRTIDHGNFHPSSMVNGLSSS
jgi:hypothetical protein